MVDKLGPDPSNEDIQHTKDMLQIQSAQQTTQVLQVVAKTVMATEKNNQRREAKQLSAIKEGNSILSFLFDATEENIEVNQEKVDAQALADLQEKERIREEQDKKKKAEALSLKSLEDGTKKMVANKGFQGILAATLIGILSIEGVQEFVTEKFVPAIESFLDYASNTALPFIIDNFSTIATFLGIFAVSTLALRGLFATVSGIQKLVKVWQGIKASYLIIKAGTIALGLELKKVAVILGAKFKALLSTLVTTAQFIRFVTIPMLITALSTMVTTIAAALAPFLPIIVVVGAAIAGIVTLFFMIKKHFSDLGLEGFKDILPLTLASIKDGLGMFGNLFIMLANKIGDIGAFFAELVGAEVPEFLTDLQGMEKFSTNNTAEAINAGQLRNRERLEKEIVETEDPEKRESLIQELTRVDQLIEKRQGIEAPERDFTKLRVEKLKQDEMSLGENIAGATGGFFQNIIDNSSTDMSTNSSGGSTPVILNNGGTPDNPNQEMAMAT